MFGKVIYFLQVYFFNFKTDNCCKYRIMKLVDILYIFLCMICHFMSSFILFILHVTMNRVHFVSFQSLQYIIVSYHISQIPCNFVLAYRTCLIIRLVSILPFHAGRLYKQAYHICSNIIPYTMTHDTFLLRFIISYCYVHFLH